PRKCSLNEVIQASIDSVSTYADQNGIHLEGPDTQIPLYADPDRIVQVLVNLLSNAIKFSPGDSSVVVSATAVDDEVEVRVKDRGRGVPAHLREAVFERFRQVASSDATDKGGTGLGLPICKEIVELHGGKIGVESEEGQGSTFWFRLPLSPAAAPKAAATSASLPVPLPRRKTLRIAPRTIYEKGLILISIPLLVEFAFGITMFSVQRFYEEKLAKERAAVEIMFHANEMWINCIELMMMKAYFNLFGGPKLPFEERITRIIDENRILKKLVAG